MQREWFLRPRFASAPFRQARQDYIKKGARRSSARIFMRLKSERYLSIRGPRPPERRINKARGGNVKDFGFVVTGLAQVVRLRSRLGTLTRLMAVRSQMALAKFLGHFFNPHFFAKKRARRSERPLEHAAGQCYRRARGRSR